MCTEHVISRENWSLHRKGEIDRQRHQNNVREAFKKNLADIVSEDRLMTNLCDPANPLLGWPRSFYGKYLKAGNSTLIIVSHPISWIPQLKNGF